MKLANLLIPPCVRGFASTANTFDVDIENGVVAGIEPARSPGEAASGTLLPCPADLHVHIDKTYVVGTTGAPPGDLFQAIARMAAHRATWSADDLGRRMQRALLDAYGCGTRAMRTHLDWAEPQPPLALEVFERQRAAWRGRLSLQCVSLTPLDLFDDADPSALVPSDCGERIAAAVAAANARCDRAHGESALLGAFVYRNDRLQHKLRRVFDLALRHDLDLDFHVDEGLHPHAEGLRAIAELAIHTNYRGRVTCGHACSLAMQPLALATSTLQLCARAGIHLVSLPTTNLHLQGAWDATPVERGITRIGEARANGVATSIATDNVADAFYPYGSYDLLETFGLGVQVAHLSPADDWLRTITTHPARAMGLGWDGSIAAGCPADLLLLGARDGFELLTPAGRRRRVMRGGAFIDT